MSDDDEHYELFDSLEGARTQIGSDDECSPLDTVEANITCTAQATGGAHMRPKPPPITTVASGTLAPVSGEYCLSVSILLLLFYRQYCYPRCAR
jgi:hypothetical protein